ncbi:MAG: hypothetical protein WC955_11180 [Elusimicrobiota bacterium]
MKKIVKCFSVIVLMVMINIMISSRASAEIKLGISVTDDGIQSFHLGISNYYHVPEREVMVIRERGIDDDDLPVVFFIASHARVSSDVILSLRAKQMSWFTICTKYGLSADIFYYPMDYVIVKGSPYGRAYGYYQRPKKQWKKIVLIDDDIVNLVNMRFFVEQHGYSPEEVVKMRSSGKKFSTIYSEKKNSKSSSKATGHKKGNKKRK